jgi:hypothetical protein
MSADVRAHLVQEVPVVRDDDQRAVVAEQELLEPLDRLEVEVVRRLVEQERLRVAEQRLRQQHAHLLPALELAHLPLVQVIGDIEPLEQDRRVALRAVAILLADDALQLAEAHAVFVGHLGFGVQRLALLERLPQPMVAHDDGVDDAVVVEGVLVLPEHAELAGAAHRAPLRLQLTREQLHERGLAGPVRSRQAVPIPGRERRRHVLEQDLRPVPHRHTTHRNHSDFFPSLRSSPCLENPLL